MKATRIVGSLILTSVLGSMLAAQAAPAKKQEGHPQAGAPKAAAPREMPKEAGMRSEGAHELSFAVTGLTKDNLSKTKEGLQGLAMHVFTCDTCKVEEPMAGSCPKCKGALKPESHPVFTSIQPSSDTGMIAVTLEPKATLRYSELEGALTKNGIKIDPTRFTLPGRAHLIVRGATADAAPAIEKALTDAKLFDEVKAKFDPNTKELAIMVRAGSSSPSRSKVSAALESAKAQLADIVWGPMSLHS